mmetsp:Transcript_50503/g.98964  ORF Transcript_50503/g.98964 Transcript_50503/m.98964 type:complete len:226 (-) Transcript_50503:197-874(-)|eukprot:CAMPEP_0175141754 /NCGR_PEP_ID=MMETSP0087-20121206/12328_1 /TAXON_ID=136419 /ORGANISM="Unknown Unknown, Strain D1" /LENGTH=225 /DNA_ID=CAMNT_0016425299 /DNA_START=39 /DNA_END=716 /DNA_ORIENTATION=-
MKFFLVLSLLLNFVAAGTNAASKKFLEENKSKDGVVTLPSGLQYKVLREGDGAFHPTVDSSCSCHYHGTLIDGTTFDSSYDRGSPTDFAPNQVIKGWTEAMQLMVEGDKWEMYIPSELAYGDGGSPPKIQGGDALIFQMEILKINGNKVPASRCDPEKPEKCSEKEVKFIDSIKAKLAKGFDLAKEHARLTKMKGKKMKEDLVTWLNKRLNIISQMQKGKPKKEL